MQNLPRVVSAYWCVLTSILISIWCANPARAQLAYDHEQEGAPTSADHQAAQDAKVIYRHARPANTQPGKTLRARETAQASPASGVSSNTSGSTALHNGVTRFPGDVSYFGGNVVPFAAMHVIYLLPSGSRTCTAPGCWGNPEGFLKDLNMSEFIHITDQYVGVASSGRYPLESRAFIYYKQTSAVLTDQDVQGYVHGMAKKTGQTGYDHIYHVFLPPGQDECFAPLVDGTGICYSPDMPNNFFFCSYHSSVNFQDIGPVLYTVQPYQDVPGCSVRPGTPHGMKIDSTDNTLSHEIFETITDPDGDGWINFSVPVLRGAEIGDECSFFVVLPVSPTNVMAFFDPDVFRIGRNEYAVQPEYSNSAHACPTVP